MPIKMERNYFKMEIIPVIYVNGELTEKTAMKASTLLILLLVARKMIQVTCLNPAFCKLATSHYQNVKAKYLKQWIDFIPCPI